MDNTEEFHAVIIDKSLISLDILSDFKILSETSDGAWIIYKISLIEKDLVETIKKIQFQMYDANWYCHFYNSDGSRMVVVFKNKFFEISNNPLTWTEVVDYGVSLGTPKEQLDFVPNRFEDEKY
ncbi:MAG: hypothetical protein WCK26_02765 [Candidatus Saccharibacteria bacterium]